MGRIVKGARFGQNRYVVAIPQHSVPSDGAATNGNGHSHGETVDFSPLIESISEPQEIRVDWDALRDESTQIIDDAQTNAEALIADAQQRAIELISDAAVHAQDIEDGARKAGFDQGQADGHAAAGAELETMLSTMRGLVDVARAERHKIIEGAEPEIIRLAMLLAEKIIHQQISVDKEVVLSMTRAAIALLVNRETVTVRVNPADIEMIREHKDRMMANTDIEHLRMIEDNRVDPGGIVLETESGTIDAKITTQLREAKRLLHVEDEVVPVDVSGDASLLAASVQAS